MRLINGKNEELVWTEEYKSAMTATDILEIQSDIALQVAENLKAVVNQEVKKRIKARPTENTEAYILYLQARYAESYQQQMQMMEKAVSLDPGFADAYAKMASTRMWYRGDSLSREQILEKVEPLLNKALQLDKNSLTAHETFAEFRLFFYWDFETVEKEFQIFKQLSPSNTDENFSLIQYLWAVGRFQEAHTICKAFFNSDETSSTQWVFMALSYLYIGEQEKALETIETALRVFPHSYLIFTHGYALFRNALSIFVSLARYEEAIELFEKNTAGIDINDLDDRILGTMGIAYFKTGNKSKATAILNELLSRNKSVDLNDTYIHVAEVYVAMDKNDKALQYLEKAYTKRETGMVVLKTDPSFQPLHGDPRFEDLLRKIGFK